MTEELHGLGGKLGAVAGRSNKGKSILQTIDPEFILGIGKVSEFGARKYHLRNFLMTPGMDWGSVYESLLRHLFAFWNGEENDEESGLPHLLHAAWNVMVLYTYSHRIEYAPGDNRPSTNEWEGKLWADWETNFNSARGTPITATVSFEDSGFKYGATK